MSAVAYTITIIITMLSIGKRQKHYNIKDTVEYTLVLIYTIVVN